MSAFSRILSEVQESDATDLAQRVRAVVASTKLGMSPQDRLNAIVSKLRDGVDELWDEGPYMAARWFYMPAMTHARALAQSREADVRAIGVKLVNMIQGFVDKNGDLKKYMR